MNTKEFWVGAAVVVLAMTGVVTVLVTVYTLAFKPTIDCSAGYVELFSVCVQGYKP